MVAALTIPTLMSKYQKQQYVIGLKKAYSQLQNAIKMIPITEGCSAGDYDCAGLFDAINIDGKDFEGSRSKKTMYLFSKQFKTQKILFNAEEDICNVSVGNAVPCFQTTDGMIFGVDTAHTFGISVDINGAKGPNETARDRFPFVITYNKSGNLVVTPYGSKEHADSYGHNEYYWRTTTSTVYSGNCTVSPEFCTGQVLEEDAMNY